MDPPANGLALPRLDDDLDFYDHDHQHKRQEVKMFVHLFLQVEAGGVIPAGHLPPTLPVLLRLAAGVL